MANGYMQQTPDDITTLGDVYNQGNAMRMAAPVPWLEGRTVAETSDPLTQAIMKGKYVSAHLLAIRQAPPEQKQLAYTASRRDLVNRGLLQPGAAGDPGPIYPGDESIRQMHDDTHQQVRQLERHRATTEGGTKQQASPGGPFTGQAQPRQGRPVTAVRPNTLSGTSQMRNDPATDLQGGAKTRQSTPLVVARRPPDEKANPQWGGDPSEPLALIAEHRDAIHAAAKKYGVSPEAIATIIYQEKYNGGFWTEFKNLWPDFNAEELRVSTPHLKFWRPWKPWKEGSIGLAEMQFATAAHLMGKDLNDPKQADEVVAALHNNNRSIDLIGQYIAENQRAIGRKLTPLEAGMGHNAGIRGLKSYIEGRRGLEDVPARAKGHEQEISRALRGEVAKPRIRYRMNVPGDMPAGDE